MLLSCCLKILRLLAILWENANSTWFIRLFMSCPLFITLDLGWSSPCIYICLAFAYSFSLAKSTLTLTPLFSGLKYSLWVFWVTSSMKTFPSLISKSSVFLDEILSPLYLLHSKAYHVNAFNYLFISFQTLTSEDYISNYWTQCIAQSKCAQIFIEWMIGFNPFFEICHLLCLHLSCVLFCVHPTLISPSPRKTQIPSVDFIHESHTLTCW